MFRRKKETFQIPESNDTKLEVNFYWDKEEQEWAGLSRDDLIFYIEKIIKFFHIPQQNLGKINLHFGNNLTFRYSNGTVESILAKNIPSYDDDNQVVQTDIIINKSIEALFEEYGLDRDWFDNERLSERDTEGEYDYKIEDSNIVLTLREPWEAILWILAEELNHSHVDLKFGKFEKKEQASAKYEKYVTDFLNVMRGDPNVEDYTFDLVEVTAARQVLRFLEMVAIEKGLLDRAKLFRQVYELSLEKRMVVKIRTAFILDQIYT